LTKVGTDDKEWSEWRKITIDSKAHYDELLRSGYEIYKIKFYWDLGRFEVSTILTKGEERVVADATPVSDYFMHLQELYDFNKKKPIFVWVPDTSLYWDFEETFFNMLTQKHSRPLFNKMLDSQNYPKIYDSLVAWMKKEKYAKYRMGRLSEIFSLVCILNEKGGDIITNIYSKETITLQDVHRLLGEAKDFENSVALSFFYLSENRTTAYNDFNDMLTGIIIYDLKNKQTLCFNIQSLVSFCHQHVPDANLGLYDIALDLFNK
jgi:hypothetical protein